ncbi:MAG TPA: alpha/beta hydrolase [Steroidobacteraceae bacterium]|jgi:pimeloyl-ACP methyl ester carboxylesterase|nr:alpha/beta hydrolase [Steroidobacteraceae bacterium]
MMRVIAVLISASIALGVNAATLPSGATPNITGTWQGTLQAPAPNLRIALQISRTSGSWKASMYSIDQTPDHFPVTALSLTGSRLKFEVDEAGAVYEGTVSADGSSIGGTWTEVARGQTAPLNLHRATQATAWPLYDSGYTVRFVTVEPGIDLEVLDWGGHGRPVILLAGLGNTAHVFDKFAPTLTARYRVYGITRRGFGDSSAPSSGYSVDRLGQDVLAVMDALKIERPILIGHSLAGEELSYVGSRDPQKIAGLVYLDAGYGYAFYDKPKDAAVPSIPPDVDLEVDVDQLQRKLTQIVSADDIPTRVELFNESASELVQVRNDLQAQEGEVQAGGGKPAQLAANPINTAILAGMDKFTQVNAPILAIYADPHAGIPVPTGTSKAEATGRDKASVEAQIAALTRYNPSAQIIRLPNAVHYVFISNEAEVLKDVQTFIDTLPMSRAAPLSRAHVQL